MAGSGNGIRNRGIILRAGIAIGAWGIAVAVGAGVAAEARDAGLAVAPTLASTPLHFRSAILIFAGCLAPILAVVWARLSSDVQTIARMKTHLIWALGLCAALPLVTLAVNYAIATGLSTDHIALLPALGALAVAVLYWMVTGPLSGITGVGLATRLLLRTSALWLIVFAALQLGWIAVRAFANQPDLLWYIERPAIELAFIGFGIPGALGVLTACLSSMYHSRNMTQVVMRAHYPYNGLLVLWTLVGMWAERFPGGYQDLAAPVIAIGLLVFMSLIAAGSGLLDWRKMQGRTRPDSANGVRAPQIASLVMLLMIVVGALLTIDSITRAALGAQPLGAILNAIMIAVGLGAVPLALAAALAAMRGRTGSGPALGIGAALIAGAVFVGIPLRLAEGVIDRSMAGLTISIEVAAAVGMGLLVLAAVKTVVQRA